MLLIVGKSKSGKTHLLLEAPNLLLLEFDPAGEDTLVGKKDDMHIIRYAYTVKGEAERCQQHLSFIENVLAGKITKERNDDERKILAWAATSPRTLAFDTISNWSQMQIESLDDQYHDHFEKNNPTETLSQGIYGFVMRRLHWLIPRLRVLDATVIFTAHIREDITKNREGVVINRIYSIQMAGRKIVDILHGCFSEIYLLQTKWNRKEKIPTSQNLITRSGSGYDFLGSRAGVPPTMEWPTVPKILKAIEEAKKGV